MRILHVTPTYLPAVRYGGPIRSVHGLAKAQAARGHDVGAAIAYAYRALPGGGEVRIATADPEAVRAVHAFLAFQRADHRAH